MTKLTNGEESAEKVQTEIVEKIQKLKDNGIHPGLVVLLVGESSVSQICARDKERIVKEIGVHSLVERYPEMISEGELFVEIEKYNQDPGFHGTLVQLPLPKHIDEERILLVIRPEKDVDGFHPISLGRLLAGKPGKIPCTPYSIIKMFGVYSIDPAGKRAVVIGRGNIVGRLMVQLLLMADTTVTVAHSKTGSLAGLAQEADILVVTIGRGYFATEKFVKSGAVVIDVGMNRDVNGKLIGDVKFNKVEPIIGWITPVPKGVEPMTITMLMYQTVKSAKAFGAGEQMAQEYSTATTLTKRLKRRFDADPYLECVYLIDEISNFRSRANAYQYLSFIHVPEPTRPST